MDKQALMRCDIISAERELFSGDISFLSVSGVMGELGIAPGHTPLLTQMRPGPAVLRKEQGDEEVFYISSGYLEVQADHVTILADTAQRAADIDENMAIKAREEAERETVERRGTADYAQAATSLAQRTAQLRALQELRDRSK
jgi:F-type H+-transporting ATPase subunit epsilon